MDPTVSQTCSLLDNTDPTGSEGSYDLLSCLLIICEPQCSLPLSRLSTVLSRQMWDPTKDPRLDPTITKLQVDIHVLHWATMTLLGICRIVHVHNCHLHILNWIQQINYTEPLNSSISLLTYIEFK